MAFLLTSLRISAIGVRQQYQGISLYGSQLLDLAGVSWASWRRGNVPSALVLLSMVSGVQTRRMRPCQVVSSFVATSGRVQPLKKRLLITGASGFIGSHCLRLLRERDYDLLAVSRRPRLRRVARIRWIQADLLDRAQLLGLFFRYRPTHLLHIAWNVSQRNYWTSRENERWLLAGIQLMEAFAKSGGERLVMAGTCAEYDWSQGLCSELTTPRRPNSLYGLSKNALQEQLYAYSIQTGLSSAWGRIFYVFGPRESPHRIIPSVILSLLMGKAVSCTEGNQVRDFLYVEDVASALVHLLASDAQGPVNIGSGFPISLREILTRVGKKLASENLIRFGALPTPLYEPPKILADVGRLINEVGWRPRYSLDAGLDKSIQSWSYRMAEVSDGREAMVSGL